MDYYDRNRFNDYIDHRVQRGHRNPMVRDILNQVEFSQGPLGRLATSGMAPMYGSLDRLHDVGRAQADDVTYRAIPDLGEALPPRAVSPSFPLTSHRYPYCNTMDHLAYDVHESREPLRFSTPPPPEVPRVHATSLYPLFHDDHRLPDYYFSSRRHDRRPYYTRPLDEIVTPSFYTRPQQPFESRLRSPALENGPELYAQRKNADFPFKPYRASFTPYAPYKHVHPPVSKRLNPDWVTYKPYEYRWHQFRYMYEPEPFSTLKDMEMFRISRPKEYKLLFKKNDSRKWDKTPVFEALRRDRDEMMKRKEERALHRKSETQDDPLLNRPRRDLRAAVPPRATPSPNVDVGRAPVHAPTLSLTTSARSGRRPYTPPPPPTPEPTAPEPTHEVEPLKPTREAEPPKITREAEPPKPAPEDVLVDEAGAEEAGEVRDPAIAAEETSSSNEHVPEGPHVPQPAEVDEKKEKKRKKLIMSTGKEGKVKSAKKIEVPSNSPEESKPEMVEEPNQAVLELPKPVESIETASTPADTVVANDPEVSAHVPSEETGDTTPPSVELKSSPTETQSTPAPAVDMAPIETTGVTHDDPSEPLLDTGEPESSPNIAAEEADNQGDAAPEQPIPVEELPAHSLEESPAMDEPRQNQLDGVQQGSTDSQPDEGTNEAAMVSNPEGPVEAQASSLLEEVKEVEQDPKPDEDEMVELPVDSKSEETMEPAVDPQPEEANESVDNSKPEEILVQEESEVVEASQTQEPKEDLNLSIETKKTGQVLIEERDLGENESIRTEFEVEELDISHKA